MSCNVIGFVRLCLAAIFVGILSFARADDNWPKFRGPLGTGVAEGKDLPDAWSAIENVAWKAEIPGRGWSSPIVWRKRVFLTTTVNTGTTPESKKGLYLKGEQREPPDSEHQWKVICLDLDSGKQLWEQTAHTGKPPTTLHIKNTYASETPVTDGNRIYAYFGNLGVYCYDLDGTPVWSKKIEPHPTQAGWGPAASPALSDNRLFILNDNQEHSYLAAFDATDGEPIWQVDRDERSNWSTPFVWKNELRTEIVTAGTKRVRSYDFDGKLLWELSGMSMITIGTPFADAGLLYVSSGYVLDLRQRPIYAIRPGADGDITLPADKNSSAAIAWCQRGSAPYNPSTLVYRDRMYVLYDRSLLGCYNARTGDPVYERQRIADGKAFTASPWAYDGKVFCLNEYGETFVFAAGDEFKPLHVNALADDDMGMASPAIAGDRLLLRTSERLYCIRKTAAK